MQIAIMFDQLASLDTSRTSWRIKVRVTRMWPSLSSGSNGSNTLYGYNLILLDDDVSLPFIKNSFIILIFYCLSTEYNLLLQFLISYKIAIVSDFPQNSHVQAFVYAENWKSISKHIVEGGVHVITNFYTKEATSSLRPTSAKVVINFSNSTTVEKVETDDYMIPMNKFEFSDLGDLYNIVMNYENAEAPPFAIGLYIFLFYVMWLIQNLSMSYMLLYYY